MPITAEVCQKRSDSCTLSKETNNVQERVKKERQVDYQVKFSGLTSPDEVDSFVAATWPGVPVIGRDIYVDPITGDIYPYWSVKNKTATRDEEASNLFDVAVTWNDDSGEASQGQSKPVDPEDLSPSLVWSATGQEDVAYDDLNGNRIMLPTGTFYQNPVTRKEASLIATVTQIENSFDKDDLTDRLYKVNDATWQGEPGGVWMITDIRWEEVEIPLSNDTVQLANRITYKIEEKDRFIKRLKDDGTTETVLVGWHQTRIRADSRYLRVADDRSTIKPVMGKETMGLSEWYLKTDGTPHTKAAQEEVPPQDIWEVQPGVSFAFLRV